MNQREAALMAILRVGRDASMRGAGLSLSDALTRCRYKAVRPTLEPSELVPLIQAHPSLCEDWFAYSEDKRTSGGWYILRDGGVGRVKPAVSPKRFNTTEEAVANFIVRELDFWSSDAG